MKQLVLPAPQNSYYDLEERYELHNSLIFVYGSNLAGRHGAGAAKEAFEKYGAVYGKGIGLQGRSYGIPTKDRSIITLPIRSIEFYVRRFVEFTKQNNGWFYVTPVGTGLAGFKHEEIAYLFKGAQNCWFPLIWKPYLEE